MEGVFDEGVRCSMKACYPDWLSLTGDGYVPSMYKRYGKVVSPMGCVHGKETIQFRIGEKQYRTTFENAWNMLSSKYKVHEQIPGQPHLYISTGNEVSIYDSQVGGYVIVKTWIRNVSDNWVRVTTKNGRNILCTTDHPLTLSDKVTTKSAIELVVDKDSLITTGGISVVVKVEPVLKMDFSYDVTTESEHFDVSGIWSHNCRAFLSPWYEHGGAEPEDEEDMPVFVGRSNVGRLKCPFVW